MKFLLTAFFLRHSVQNRFGFGFLEACGYEVMS